MVTGGCFCGQVRYEAHGTPFNETACHCSDCRRAPPAPSVAWFSGAASALRFVSGHPTRFAPSPGAERSFCPNCGTPLTFQRHDLPDEIDVATCSLDDPEALPPRDHIRTSGRLSWVQLADRLPTYAASRSEG